MKCKVLLLFLPWLLFACKPHQQLVSSSTFDSVSTIEVLVPQVVNIPGDSVEAVFKLNLNGGSIKPSTVAVKSANTDLIVSVSATGQVLAKATVRDRVDTVMVTQRTQRTITTSKEVVAVKENRLKIFFKSIKSWFVGLFILIGLITISYFVFSIIKKI